MKLPLTLFAQEQALHRLHGLLAVFLVGAAQFGQGAVVGGGMAGVLGICEATGRRLTTHCTGPFL